MVIISNGGPMYILISVTWDIDGTVSAKGPALFKFEEDAVSSAVKMLAADFGISEETLEYEGQENSQPYVLSYSRSGKFSAYMVAKLPSELKIKHDMCSDKRTHKRFEGEPKLEGEKMMEQYFRENIDDIGQIETEIIDWGEPVGNEEW